MPTGGSRKASKARKAVKARSRRAQGRVRELPLFDSRKFLTSAGAGRTAAVFAANQRIFRHGDACAGVFFIERGKVQLTVASDQGRHGVVAILGPGEFFGEGCLAGQPVHLSSATAMEESQIIRVDLETMVRTLAEQANLAEFFIGHLLSRNIRFEADLVDQLFKSSEKRLARVLLMLSNFGKEGTLNEVLPKISQDVLAAKVGTTRSRINFFMNKFRKLGFIDYNGGLQVHSALLNVIVHD